MAELKAEYYAAQQQQQKDFEQEVAMIEQEAAEFGQHVDLAKVKIIAEKARRIETKVKDFTARMQTFNKNEMLFGVDPTDYKRIPRMGKTFEPYLQAWTTMDSWTKWTKDWHHNSLMTLDANDIRTNVETAFRTLAKTLKSALVTENAPLQAIISQSKEEIDQFKPILPLIGGLRNPGIRERHWNMMTAALGYELRPDKDPSFTLHKALTELHLDEKIDVIAKIGDSAGKEYQIEQSLDNMLNAWKEVYFDVVPYRETGTYIIRKTDVIMALLDEHRVLTQGMNFSAFKGPFEERITSFDKQLGLMSEILEEWGNAQRQWMYLQPIFESPDINKQLPAESQRFKNVNKTYRAVLLGAFKNPHVLSYTGNAYDLLQKFQEGNKVMDNVQKQLSQYLDQKRKAFGRFFFLSNDELLQILSQTKDVTKVQPHLKKCFENVAKLTFEQDLTITSMFSGENEEIKFVSTLDPSGKSVEFWLGEVESMMKVSMKHVLNEACKDYTTCKRSQWVFKHAGQCVLNGSQFHWTREVEHAMRTKGADGVADYYKFSNEQLLEMVALVREKLSFLQSMTMGALIVLDVHARDVMEKLAQDRVGDEKEFGWLSQLRYYIKEGGDMWAKMVQAEFPYGYEYLGNTPRLVITPLTDRCYMTLMTALQLHLGGAPAGPAGTGKTETTKDLAKAVAKQCVVFNCSDGLDAAAMGKFFKGLAQSGAWACFDEFNRIDIEVLSVVAQQIMTIWNGIKEGKTVFIFEDDELKLDATCSVFITMNPGYAGRTELPDNLKALFRPVAMMVPNYALIAEISLYSFGYARARYLSTKMVATFTLSSEQLSSQDHYDYGMRAVKTTISQAGILKRQFPDMDEDVLVLRALCDVNIPKFLKDDLPLFEGIIADLFPGIKKPKSDFGALLASIQVSCTEMGLQPVPQFITKVIQLYETTIVRHGLMVVGPTGAGKTNNWRCLQKAMSKLEDVPGWTRTVSTCLNPKSITMGQLYGQNDEATKEWADGILAYALRAYMPPQDNTDWKKWIVFDGPVDAIWIENMNTVLDDNKKLCLTSGEIIALLPTMTMMFEVSDLSVASPATVSRCGMVYMDPDALGLSPPSRSWLESLPPNLVPLRKTLQVLIDQALQPALSFMRKYCAEPVQSRMVAWWLPVSEVSCVLNEVVWSD
jgi:dynein heavy chain